MPSSERPLRVWLVDDDASLREMLSLVLVARGYDTRCFDGGHEAARALLDAETSAREAPHLIVSDVRMREGGGLELLHTVERRDVGPPVLLMTAFGSEALKVRALALGAAGLLSKPFELSEFIERVASITGTSGEVRSRQEGPA